MCARNKCFFVRAQEGGGTKYFELNANTNSQHLTICALWTWNEHFPMETVNLQEVVCACIITSRRILLMWEILHPVIFKRIIKFKWQELKLIVLVQDGNDLLTFVNPVMNILVSQIGGKFLCQMRNLLS